jgi:hypothetical protein
MRHTVDRVEETKKADSANGSTEGFPERAHKLKELLLFFLLFLIAFKATLPLLKCSESHVSLLCEAANRINLLPGEVTHLFVSGLGRLVMRLVAGLYSLTESNPT